MLKRFSWTLEGLPRVAEKFWLKKKKQWKVSVPLPPAMWFTRSCSGPGDKGAEAIESHWDWSQWQSTPGATLSLAATAQEPCWIWCQWHSSLVAALGLAAMEEDSGLKRCARLETGEEIWDSLLPAGSSRGCPAAPLDSAAAEEGTGLRSRARTPLQVFPLPKP